MHIFKVILTILLFFTTGVVAKEKKYSSHIDIGYKIGSDRNLSKVEFFSPIIQSDKSLWFIDLRGWVDDNDTSENNLGLGYRKMINDKYILGLYSFYDIRKTDLNNEFKQKTYGIEILTEDFDFRANYYDADEKQFFTNAQPNNSNPTIVGTQVFVSQPSFETSFSGYDLEVGTKIPQIKDLSAFLTYYKFQNDRVNIDLDGYRVRAEYVAHKSKDHKHNLILEAEYSNDDLRDDITFYGLRYHYKFGKPKGLNKLEQRMTNRVVRDIDIIVPQIIPTDKKILVNEDGATTSIKFVDFDAAAGGDGSEGSPYNSFADFNTKFAVNDVIYVLPQDDVNVRDAVNIQLLDGQKLVSAKEGVMVSDITGNADHNFTIKKNSSANLPKVKQILTGNNNLVRGFDVSNEDAAIEGEYIAGTGIVVNEKTGNIISGNNLSNNQKYAIYAKTVSGHSVSVSDNTASNNNSGILVWLEDDSHGVVSGNTANTNADVGIGLVTQDNSTGIINGNTTSNNDGIGINGISFGNGFASLGNNIVRDNQASGIVFSANHNGTLSVSGNTISGNVEDGIKIVALNDSAATIENNTLSENGADGIYVDAKNSSSNIISGNNISSSGSDGVYVESNDSSNNTISGNDINDSGEVGIDIISKGNSTNIVSENTIYNNPIGVFLTSNDLSNNAITLNTITNSSNVGLRGNIFTGINSVISFDGNIMRENRVDFDIDSAF